MQIIVKLVERVGFGVLNYFRPTQIIVAHKYAPDERTSDFWIDHAETLEFLNAWLFDLQDY